MLLPPSLTRTDIAHLQQLMTARPNPHIGSPVFEGSNVAKHLPENDGDDDEGLDPNHLIPPYWKLAMPEDCCGSTSKPRLIDPADVDQQMTCQELQKLRGGGAALTSSPESPRCFAWNRAVGECRPVDAHEIKLYKMCEDLSRKLYQATCDLSNNSEKDHVPAGVISVKLSLAKESAERTRDRTATLGGKGAWVHAQTTAFARDAQTMLDLLEEKYE